MNTKHYEKLLSMAMEKVEQLEVEKTWLKYENKQLKEQVERFDNNENKVAGG